MTMHAPAGEEPLQQRLPDRIFLALTVLALVLCFFVARPFLTSLAWAAALAVVTAPVHARLERRLRFDGIAAACTVAVLAAILVVATGLLLPRVTGEVFAGFIELRAQVESRAWEEALLRHAPVAAAWEWLRLRADPTEAINRVAALLPAASTAAVRWSLVVSVEIVLAFFFLFYFLRDRERIVASLHRLMPTSHAETTRILDAARATVMATLYGKVLIGIVQGFLGGLMFWWLGLAAPWFWAIVMGVLSIVPLVGAPLVWIPAAILLVLHGRWADAAVLAGWGAIVVGLADNVLYPLVVGRHLRLHTTLLLIALIGGLVVFGPTGFFLGPVLLAVTATMLEIWRDRAGAAP